MLSLPMVPRVALAVLALCAAPVAQNLLPLPPSHAASEGTASTNVPFGRSTPVRVQYAYDGSLFAGPVTITSIAFRLDGGATAAPKVVDCELRCSTMPAALVAMSVDFASNRGADEAVVLPRQLLTLPAHAAAATPSPFLPPVPFAAPFAYDPQQGPLLLEIVVYGQPPGAYSLDVTYVCSSPDLPFGPGACVGSTGLPLRVQSASDQVLWGRPWTAQVQDALPGTFVALLLGSSEVAWSGVPLPIDLAFLGSPGCFLSTDAWLLVVALADVAGNADFPFAVPNSPTWLGEWIRFQGVALDPAASAGGLVSSQAQKVQVCGWEPVARLWAGGVGTALGVRELGVGAVVRLGTQ